MVAIGLSLMREMTGIGGLVAGRLSLEIGGHEVIKNAVQRAQPKGHKDYA